MLGKSSVDIVSNFLGGRAIAGHSLLDYETGGKGINDTSEGLDYQIWRGRKVGGDVILDTEGDASIPDYVVISGDITEFSFSFDANMQPVVAFVESGITKLYWYDTSTASFITDVINGITPKVSMVDKRRTQEFYGVVLMYARDGGIYYRLQEDRYGIERYWDVGYALDKIGMNVNQRFQVNAFC